MKTKQVRSLTLDKWSDARLELMAQVGNKVSNDFMEYSHSTDKSTDKRRPGSERSRNEANDWIQSKYIDLTMIDMSKFIQEDASDQKYDIGKGLIQAAAQGEVAHVLFHLSLAAMVKKYKSENKTEFKHEMMEEYFDKYDDTFVLSQDVLSKAYHAASSNAVKEALVLNGFEL